ncbi:hypothetical protein LEWO105114_03235 [Legionella worsleiensis]|nr:Uncharacterised protein [Legionella worsleiensis]
MDKTSVDYTIRTVRVNDLNQLYGSTRFNCPRKKYWAFESVVHEG